MPKTIITPSSLKAKTVSQTDAPASDLLSFDQYIQQIGSVVHPYSVAYLRPTLFGILKTKSDWDTAMQSLGVT